MVTSNVLRCQCVTIGVFLLTRDAVNPFTDNATVSECVLDNNGRREHTAIRRAGGTASASATKPTWNRQGN